VDEIYVFVKESEARERRKARAALFNTIRGGGTPGFEHMAKARGLVTRERENSIFTDAWILLAIIFLIIGFIDNRNDAFLALGIALILIAGVSTAWKRIALAGVTYERNFDRSHAFPGEPVVMTLTISNLKPLPLTWLQFIDELPVPPEESGTISFLVSEITGIFSLQNTLSMNAYERTRRETILRFPKRGYYDIGPVRYQSGDIFTLFTVERQHDYTDTLIIYPPVWPLDALMLPAKEMFGEINVRRSLFTDPIRTRGIRDYQPQDRFRDVHWKATARRGNLQTKVYDPTSGMTIVVFLNVATYPKHWMGFEPDLLERAISVSASIVSYAAEQKWGVGIYANGSVPGSDQPIRVPPGRAPDQLVHMLEALAAVTEFATGSIELLMHRESPRLPWASTFVLVSATVTDEILVSLYRLKEAGRRVVLISLADELPARMRHGIPIYHSPATAPAFQHEQKTTSATETALNKIPIPRPIVPNSELANHDANGQVIENEPSTTD
jgi:uncharacterized protein (DUF58 family)